MSPLIFSLADSPTRVLVTRTKKQAHALAVAFVRSAMIDREQPLIGLATGRTFHGFYDALVSEESAGTLDPASARFIHLDEYLGATPDTPGGMARELEDRFFSRLHGNRPEFHPTPGVPEDQAIDAHRNLLSKLGSADLQFLGVGLNGHIAFNEPGSGFDHETHRIELADSTIKANADRFSGSPMTAAITMGIQSILNASRIVLLAFGESKAEVAHDLLLGPITTECPATAIRLHDDATVILDKPAAQRFLGSHRATRTAEPMKVLRGPLAAEGPVLIASPHPDDASISCGGLLGSLNPETRKVILTMTTGARAKVAGLSSRDEVIKLRESEVHAEAKILGCECRFLRGRFYDSGIYEEDDVQRTLEVLREINPTWVLSASREDLHPTHRMSRIVLDEALRRYQMETQQSLLLWTYEGPWFQLSRTDVNTLVLFDDAIEDKKIRAVRAHRSQIDRVPFQEGAKALARLRAISFSESDLGGTEPGNFSELPLVEAYRRELVRPGHL